MWVASEEYQASLYSIGKSSFFKKPILVEQTPVVGCSFGRNSRYVDQGIVEKMASRLFAKWCPEELPYLVRKGGKVLNRAGTDISDPRIMRILFYLLASSWDLASLRQAYRIVASQLGISTSDPNREMRKFVFRDI